MKMYVGNLPFSMDDEGLRALFANQGEVASAKVVTDRESGRSRGFGFVEMADNNAARQAIEKLNAHEVDGRTLTVNEAKPREDRGGGGGGGGRGGYGGGRDRR